LWYLNAWFSCQAIPVPNTRQRPQKRILSTCFPYYMSLEVLDDGRKRLQYFEDKAVLDAINSFIRTNNEATPEGRFRDRLEFLYGWLTQQGNLNTFRMATTVFEEASANNSKKAALEISTEWLISVTEPMWERWSLMGRNFFPMGGSFASRCYSGKWIYELDKMQAFNVLLTYDNNTTNLLFTPIYSKRLYTGGNVKPENYKEPKEPTKKWDKQEWSEASDARRYAKKKRGRPSSMTKKAPASKKPRLKKISLLEDASSESILKETIWTVEFPISFKGITAADGESKDYLKLDPESNMNDFIANLIVPSLNLTASVSANSELQPWSGDITVEDQLSRWFNLTFQTVIHTASPV
jgi:hypothetical protein